jgi:hypothetical protein
VAAAAKKVRLIEQTGKQAAMAMATTRRAGIATARGRSAAGWFASTTVAVMREQPGFGSAADQRQHRHRQSRRNQSGFHGRAPSDLPTRT